MSGDWRAEKARFKRKREAEKGRIHRKGKRKGDPRHIKPKKLRGEYFVFVFKRAERQSRARREDKRGEERSAGQRKRKGKI